MNTESPNWKWLIEFPGCLLSGCATSLLLCLCLAIGLTPGFQEIAFGVFIVGLAVLAPVGMIWLLWWGQLKLRLWYMNQTGISGQEMMTHDEKMKPDSYTQIDVDVRKPKDY